MRAKRASSRTKEFPNFNIYFDRHVRLKIGEQGAPSNKLLLVDVIAACVTHSVPTSAESSGSLLLDVNLAVCGLHYAGGVCEPKLENFAMSMSVVESFIHNKYREWCDSKGITPPEPRVTAARTGTIGAKVVSGAAVSAKPAGVWQMS
jgi:hypothetical protein